MGIRKPITKEELYKFGTVDGIHMQLGEFSARVGILYNIYHDKETNSFGIKKTGCEITREDF